MNINPNNVAPKKNHIVKSSQKFGRPMHSTSESCTIVYAIQPITSNAKTNVPRTTAS